eukprot:RCo008507
MTETAYLRSRLDALHELHRGSPQSITEVLEAMEKELEIFKDIVPGYKIKEKNLTPDMSKEVKAVNKLEQELLAVYRKFLDHVLKLTKSRVELVSDKAMLVASKLLSVGSHFNFASTLIEAVVQGTCFRTAEVASGCTSAVAELFDTDSSGEATLKAVSCIVNLIKARRHMINPEVIGALIQLRLVSVDVHHRTLKEQDKSHARSEQVARRDSALDEHLLGAQSGTTTKAQRLMQTTVLQRLVAAYLRVIEVAQNTSAVRQARLLGPTLEGLTKFALLMDIDLLQLLMKALKELLEHPRVAPLTTLSALSTDRKTSCRERV